MTTNDARSAAGDTEGNRYPSPTWTDEVLDQLTDDEKALLLGGRDGWQTHALPRLDLPSIYLTDGPHGVRKVRRADGAFGITASEPATSFPTASAVACSWNPENARRVAGAIAREAAAHGVDVLLAPGVNIIRDPRCGRAFEYFSEDPLVSGRFGAAFVRGLQDEGIAAAVKHFAANSTEDFRFAGDSVVDERALREIYLRPFERIVKQARPATVMCAYNRLNGTYCSENRQLLTGILREEWGFDGLVMTDWGATHDRAEGVAAGCDLDMPGDVPENRDRILAALDEGRLPAEMLDDAARRVLDLVDRCTHAHAETQLDRASHAALAEEVAADGAVLLQNDGVLPLRPGSRVAVVGELFEAVRFQGAGSSLVTPIDVVSARDAFDRRGLDYRYTPGFRMIDDDPDPKLVREALVAAADADVVVFFGGLSDLEESEGFDRQHLRMSAAQTTLLDQLTATETPVVLVLHAGGPVELPHADRLAAVLVMHLAGMHAGEATTSLLLGERSPAGKLAVSWPQTAADSSAADDYGRGLVARYYESIYVGYRFHDKAGTALRFAFGHGLSYTEFAYRDLVVRSAGSRVDATLTVANTGRREGSEIVQLYVRNATSAVFKADKELRAFGKVHLGPGESTTLTLSFDLGDLAYWDVAAHDWVLENGEYDVLAAASATDIRLSAPLKVTTGVTSRSPYTEAVDVAYARPPRTVPAAFAALLGRTVPTPPGSRRLTLETRLEDGRRSITGAIMYAAIVGRMKLGYRRARALPPSLARDAQVKNTHFALRMMPTLTLRSMSMASSGRFPLHVAEGIADIAAWHPIRGIRRIAGGGRTAGRRATRHRTS